MSEVATRLVEEFYDGTAERDWPAWATEAVAILDDLPKPPPDGKRERMAFYEEAMRDPKNHGALALELAYLRNRNEELANALASASNKIITGKAGLDDANACMRAADALDPGESS